MEKPKKLDKFDDMDSRDKGYQAGYNNCIEDYEEFLPDEEEIREMLVKANDDTQSGSIMLLLIKRLKPSPRG